MRRLTPNSLRHLKRTLPALLVALACGVPTFAAEASTPTDSSSAALSISRPAFPTQTVRREIPAIAVHVDSRLGDFATVRAEQALASAAQTLARFERLGLGRPSDDGDAELDIYVTASGDHSLGQAVLERRLPPNRGASGYGIVNGSTAIGPLEFSSGVIGAVTRLTLAAHDADAPLWWTEASVTFLESLVLGAVPGTDSLMTARFSHAEQGVVTDDVLLARGNAALLWSLEDDRMAARLIANSWLALGSRSFADSHKAVIDDVVRRRTGLDLDSLFLRSVMAFLVDDGRPSRFGARIETLPRIDEQTEFAVKPGGAALIQVLPDRAQDEGTRLALRTADNAWRTVLIAERESGGWDRVDFSERGDTERSVTIPWADYRSAVAVVSRLSNSDAAGFAIDAERLGSLGPVALSSMSARVSPDGQLEVSWSSAWETGLFGWVVESAETEDGPWAVASQVPTPALGLPREGTGYTWVDEWTGDLAPRFFRVVAITEHGLRVTGPSVVVTPPIAAPLYE